MNARKLLLITLAAVPPLASADTLGAANAQDPMAAISAEAPQPTAPVSVFSADFNTQVPSAFSGVTTTEGVQGYAGLGTGSNVFGGKFLRNTTVNPASKTVLTLTGLPPHIAVNVKFLLAIIDSWDGYKGGCCLPDILNIAIDGKRIFSNSFAHQSGTIGSYPKTNTPPGVKLAQKQSLGFNSGFVDSAYNMGLEPKLNNIPHTANTLTIEWYASGAGWQGGDDESWAIDNVEVSVIPPPTLHATPVAPDRIQLGWSGVPGSKSYRLQRKPGDCGSASPWSTRVERSAGHTGFADSSLKPGTAYAYRVAAYYGGKSFSPYSNCASATTPAAGTPNMPSAMNWPFPDRTSAASASATRVTLAWDDNADDETSFAIWRKAGAGDWAQIDTAPANTQKYIDNGAAGNQDATAYAYDVRACNSAGCSAANPMAVPFAPADLAATVAKAVKLAWRDASDNESGFEVFRKIGRCGSAKPWISVAGSLAAGTQSYQDGSAVSGQIYAYRVRAIYDNGIEPRTKGYSGYSGCVSATAP